MDRYKKSLELLKRAEKLIPGQAQTFSKQPAWFPKGAYPVYLEEGHDGHVWDVDENEYIDLICGLGAITLGYENAEITGDIMDMMALGGPTFSLPHPIEVELASKLHKIIPCAEMVRFAKNGTDVTNAAVRLAKAITERSYVLQFGYHGGGNDWYGAITERPAGIAVENQYYIDTFKYNDIDSLEKLFSHYTDENRCQVACVIMEPVIFTPPKDGFLEQVKELTHKNGALLIFDEMVTGFRWHLSGAQSYFNVIPDLATFGKGMANGFPISALVGKTEYMKRLEDLPIFFSYTFAGECLSMIAALATIKQMENGALDKLWQNGTYLLTLLEKSGLKLIGYPCRFHITWEGEDILSRSLFMQETAKRGLLMHSVGVNFMAAHTEEDMIKAANAILESWAIVRSAMENNKVRELLEGQPIQPAFRRM